MDALELALVTRPHQPIADRRAHARMEGPELCRRMRMEWPGLQLLVMSGYSDQTPDREVGFLVKPFTVPEHCAGSDGLWTSPAPAQHGRPAADES